MKNLIKSIRREDMIKFLSFALVFGFCALTIVCPVFASETGADATVRDIIGNFVGIICMIFQAVGVILGVYSVGQLVMAFKNEDADSKTRAGTMLVVAIVLIALPTIVQGLKLIDKIKIQKF